jgi:hypothetical protein
MWITTNVAKCKAISRYLSGETEEDYDESQVILSSGRKFNSRLPEYEKRANNSTPAFGDIYVKKINVGYMT